MYASYVCLSIYLSNLSINCFSVISYEGQNKNPRFRQITYFFLFFIHIIPMHCLLATQIFEFMHIIHKIPPSWSLSPITSHYTIFSDVDFSNSHFLFYNNTYFQNFFIGRSFYIICTPSRLRGTDRDRSSPDLHNLIIVQHLTHSLRSHDFTICFFFDF